MKKKIICALLSVLVVVISLTGCVENEKKKNDINKTREQNDDNSDITIGFVSDERGINDKGINQSADFGAKRAERELGVKYIPVESIGKDEYTKNINGLVESGCNLILGVGNYIVDDMENVASKHKDSQFVIIDSVIDLPNVDSIIFKEQEGSFLMGVIAGEMTKSNKVGFIGGKDISLINKYEAGFVAGVMSVNQEAGQYLLDRSTVKYADGFDDISNGYDMTKALYDDGCDIVYHVSGSTSLGIFNAAKEYRNSGKDVWVMGVENEQEQFKEYKDVLLSSMVKRIDNAVYYSVDNLLKKSLNGGEIIELGLKEKGVSVSTSTNEKVPEEIMESVAKYEKEIIDGKIKVPYNLQDLKNFKVEVTE